MIKGGNQWHDTKNSPLAPSELVRDIGVKELQQL